MYWSILSNLLCFSDYSCPYSSKCAVRTICLLEHQHLSFTLNDAWLCYLVFHLRKFDKTTSSICCKFYFLPTFVHITLWTALPFYQKLSSELRYFERERDYCYLSLLQIVLCLAPSCHSSLCSRGISLASHSLVDAREIPLEHKWCPLNIRDVQWRDMPFSTEVTDINCNHPVWLSLLYKDSIKLSCLLV